MDTRQPDNHSLDGSEEPQGNNPTPIVIDDTNIAALIKNIAAKIPEPDGRTFIISRKKYKRLKALLRMEQGKNSAGQSL